MARESVFITEFMLHMHSCFTDRYDFIGVDGNECPGFVSPFIRIVLVTMLVSVEINNML